MVISSGKSIPSHQLPSHTLKLNLNTFTECIGIEIERLQTRQVYSLTSTPKQHSQTRQSGYPGMTQTRTKHFAEEANLTHHHSLTSPLLKMAFSFVMNVELPNTIVSSLGKSIPSPTLTSHTLKRTHTAVVESGHTKHNRFQTRQTYSSHNPSIIHSLTPVRHVGSHTPQLLNSPAYSVHLCTIHSHTCNYHPQSPHSSDS